MPEIQRNVRPVQVDMRCECGKFMAPTGECKTSKPPLYVHRCTGCHNVESYHRCYPYIRWELIDNLE